MTFCIKNTFFCSRLMLLFHLCTNDITTVNAKQYLMGPVRESKLGPLEPEGRIIPLDQQARLEASFFRQSSVIIS